MPSSILHPPSSIQPRSAFTLVEILVTIGIFLLLTAMTLAMVNISADRDRVRGASRHLQSRLEGARDRAIYAGEPRGLRFLLDTNGPQPAGQPITVTSSVYVGAPGLYPPGQNVRTTRWSASTAYSLNARVVPTSPNNFTYRCTAAGTSGANEPVWPTTIGATVLDGTVTWTTEGGAFADQVFIDPNDLRSIRAKISLNVELGPGDYSFNELVTQGTAQGLVYKWFGSTGVLVLQGDVGTFVSGAPVIGTISGASHNVVNVEQPLWANLQSRNLLSPIARIKVPAADGNWYTVDTSTASNLVLGLTRDFIGTPPTAPLDYLLELAPSVLPNQEPILFPRNVVIDLAHSRLPRSWGVPGNPGWATRTFDIMFSPQGVVTGSDASGGLTHLLLRDLTDVSLDHQWTNTLNMQGDQLAVTVTPSTGGIASYAVNVVSPWTANTAYATGAVVGSPASNQFWFRCTTTGTSGSADPPWGAPPPVPDGSTAWTPVGLDPYLFAETGEVAK